VEDWLLASRPHHILLHKVRFLEDWFRGNNPVSDESRTSSL
jgi:hypothetical protein